MFFWLVVIGVWVRRAADGASGTRWKWASGAVYLSNFWLSLVAGLLNSFTFRYQRKRNSPLLCDESELVDSRRENVPHKP